MTDPLAKPGVLLQLWGRGVLLLGDAGCGKSDLALGLLDRGHHFVSDDRVEFERRDDGRLIGHGRRGCEGFLAVREVGVVNVAEHYGEQACVAQTAIDLVVRLRSGSVAVDLDPNIGEWELLGCRVPVWSLTATAQRNLPLLVETRLRLNLQQQRGYDASADLQSKLARIINGESP